jgi:hypothetical protein
MKPTKPQRLTPPAAPGSLLKRLVSLSTRTRLKEVTDRDPVYLAMVRQCPCLDCGMDPSGTAAHVRMQSGAHNKHGGMQKKPADRWALPLCEGCHTGASDSQHRVGEREYWARVGLNPLLVCAKLYAARGDVVRMRAVVFAAVAERESLSQICGIMYQAHLLDEDCYHRI